VPRGFLAGDEGGKKKADRSTHSTCQDILFFFEWEYAVLMQYEEIKVQLNFCMPSMQASPVLKHSVDLDGSLKRKDNSLTPIHSSFKIHHSLSKRYLIPQVSPSPPRSPPTHIRQVSRPPSPLKLSIAHSLARNNHLLLSLEVIEQDRPLLRLLAPIPHHDARAIDDLSRISFAVKHT